MNNIELNAILFYADYMSLRDTCTPVTDNCKYFYIHGTPINSCYILDLEPIYDQDNQYFKQSLQEYTLLRDKFGEEGVTRTTVYGDGREFKSNIFKEFFFLK